MDELISEYFDKIVYSAQLINGDEIKFESVQELVAYDNFSNHALKSICINFGIGNYIRIEPSPSIICAYASTLEMKFEVDSSDKSEEIKRKVRTICEKHKQTVMYIMASKFTFMHICFLMITISFFANLNVLIIHKPDDVKISGSLAVATFTVGTVIFLLISTILSYVVKRCFPAIVFYLGENIKNVEKRSKTRSDIFWGIIVAGIVSAIVSYLLS